MKFAGTLLRAEMAGLAALALCACLMGIYGFLESFLWSQKGLKLIIAPLDAAWLVFAYTGTIGFVAVLFYGAPMYALLSHKRVTSWRTVIVAGAAPGIVALFIEGKLGTLVVVCGIGIACITHFLFMRFAPNEPAQ